MTIVSHKSSDVSSGNQARCDFCHNLLPDSSFVCRDLGNPNALVGECCYDKCDDKRVAMRGIYRRPPYTIDDPPFWVCDDLAWFTLHRERSHRLRPAHSMEFPELSVTEHKVAIRREDERICTKVLLNSTFSLNLADNEDYLALVVEIATRFRNSEQLICEDIRDYIISV